MLLPFVRDLFADVENSDPFARLLSALTAASSRDGAASNGAERGSVPAIRVSGLTPTAKALHLALLERALRRPLLVLVAGNRQAEQMQPLLRAF